MKTLLVDNGSLEPAATLTLRAVAAELSVRTARSIEPVSLLHSHKVSADELGGVPAEIVETYLRRELVAGESEFTIVPLFFGPSRAITEYLPELIEKLRKTYPEIEVRIAPTLYQEGDLRLAKLLADNVREARTANFSPNDSIRVALVDHGSPALAVTAVRDSLAQQLAAELGDEVEAVAPCSMERRAGEEYDFNEPLLETLLKRDGWNSGPVIVAQLFLMPGRHAGPDGDIAKICAEAEPVAPQLRIVPTPTLAIHRGLIDVLVDRCDLLAFD
jgi:sirohydrochlorin ferrochelatase